METCAVTVEYNPFHRGHLQQLAMIRQHFGDKTGLVLCMSGPFCQRGVPALLDKGLRAKLALSMGADLVLELPQAFAIASAERFAQGAVQTLLATGVVRHLAYGCEDPTQAEQIRQLAALLAQEPAETGRAIRQGIADGRGFAASRQQAVESLTGNPLMGQLLCQSNTILAVEYEKALARWGPLPSLALPLLEKEKTSASLIRDRLWQAVRSDRKEALWELMTDLAPLLPPASTAAIMEALNQGKGFLLEEMLAPSLLLSPPFRERESLEAIAGMQGGLAGRILKALKEDPAQALAEGTSPYQAFVNRLASRAHPASRIRRAILAASLGIQAQDEALTCGGPTYIRVLAFNRRGRKLLSYMRRQASLPLIMQASDFRKLKGEKAQAQAKLDLQAQALWNHHAGLADQSEFHRPLIQVP